MSQPGSITGSAQVASAIMLTRLDLRGAGRDLRARLPRPAEPGVGPVDAVREILAGVKAGGDAAVREYTERFDGVAVDDLRVPADELKAALEDTPAPLREALEAARDAIALYHRAQVRVDSRHERDAPGGRARYPSTVLMTAIPAREAGVSELVLCVPPESDGHVAGVTLAAAALAGVDEVYRIGGAQAVAAMAYGTETIRPTDVIVGPGNVYVSVAKREVASSGLVGIPSGYAGPSEVVVVADETTPVDFAAIDVIVQAEHGPDGLAWLITWSEEVADAVTEAVSRLVASAPRRADLEATLASGGYAAVVDGPEEAIEVANLIAPEHLQLMCADAEALLPLVRNAGAVFCGLSSPAAIGDYLAGPSHVLPTNGSARFSSGLRVDDFTRHLHAVIVDDAALARVAPHVVAIAEAEGLAAHAASLTIRGAALAPDRR